MPSRAHADSECQLGALRFDRDLRNVIAFLSNQTPLGTAALKDAFARLQQIATLLNASVRLSHSAMRGDGTI
jgi:hypothetical protein